jgi:type I restriction enzyme S subunit
MSYPAYPEYKDSGVEWLGEVPAHWDVERLKHCAEDFREDYQSSLRVRQTLSPAAARRPLDGERL